MSEIEIKAGSELDRAVAVAIGSRYRIITESSTPGYPAGRFLDPVGEAEEMGADDPRLPDNVIPKYSTDLNAAFAAAERVELFSDYYYRMLGVDESDKTWGVYQQDEHHIDRPIGNRLYDTPALAICAAILKLKKDQ